MSRKITALITARRCRMKRRNACRSWLRSLTVNSRSMEAGGSDGSGAPAVVMEVARISLIADPRVENAVQQVGDEVEQDDDGGGDQEPAHHGVGVLVPDGRQ